jgi:hypothetical protein
LIVKVTGNAIGIGCMIPCEEICVFRREMSAPSGPCESTRRRPPPPAPIPAALMIGSSSTPAGCMGDSRLEDRIKLEFLYVGRAEDEGTASGA